MIKTRSNAYNNQQVHWLQHSAMLAEMWGLKWLLLRTMNIVSRLQSIFFFLSKWEDSVLQR